jgi:catechol 1,2-dioxygenase
LSIAQAEDVTPAVLAVMEQTRDPRLREIMTSLVSHLHGFIRETKLTEAEFRAATEILNEIGSLKSDTHNEMVLMAGSLGVSALVCLMNNPKGTSQNLLGPFWRMHSPPTENGGSIIRSPTPGEALRFDGTVVDGEGLPIKGAEVDIWHSSTVGLYEQQDADQADMNLRGKFTTDADGRFWFESIKPAGYPIPTNGVVGRLLAAQDRHEFRPAHVHALIFKPGYKTMISQIYAHDDPNIESDVQFGVTEALIGDYQKQADGSYVLSHCFVMTAGEAALPRPPIK